MTARLALITFAAIVFYTAYVNNGLGGAARCVPPFLDGRRE
jgi:hypothetical protein